MTQQLRNRVEAEFAMDVRSIVRSERLRTGYWRRICRLMSSFDFLLAPGCGAPPFRLDVPLPDKVGGKPVARFYDVFLAAYAFSITGLPVIALPAGLTKEGLPVGVQLVARRMREDSAIAAGAVYAAAAPELFRQPEVDLATGLTQ